MLLFHIELCNLQHMRLWLWVLVPSIRNFRFRYDSLAAS